MMNGTSTPEAPARPADTPRRAATTPPRTGHAAATGAALVLLAATPAALAGPITVISLPFASDVVDGGDFLDRGFYAQNYGADNIDTVELHYFGRTSGDYQVRLIVRQDTYDGTIVATDTVTKHFDAYVIDTIVFQLGAASTTFGGTLTFTQELLMSADPDDIFYYDTGPGGLSDYQGVVETNGTTPPLDTFRRDGVGVVITAVPAPGSALFGAGALAFLRRRRRA